MTAVVKPFPISRQVAFLMETADLLDKKQGAAADRFWQMTCRRLYARLQVQGVAHEDIITEIHAFSRSVLARLHAPIARDENPKGAA